MCGKQLSVALGRILATFVAALWLTNVSQGQSTEKVLLTFSGGNDGGKPESGLIFDKSGNLYGLTMQGGTDQSCVGGCGTVFELTPGSNGQWTQTVIHDFVFSQGDGVFPGAGDGLVFDQAGNLYGTTQNGGANPGCPFGLGCGTVFELTPNSSGGWTETILHRFGGGSDGFDPNAGVVLDKAGNLYGTTVGGGAFDNGTAFEVVRGSNGKWTEKILHSFGAASDGNVPDASLTVDGAGNLYGTTLDGGTRASGTVFMLTPSKYGWSETLLCNFHHNDGNPYASVTLDKAGNLYGTTAFMVFELKHSKTGWASHPIFLFKYLREGHAPIGSVVLDKAGNIYGTTLSGGKFGLGTVFKLTHSKAGWKETVLYSFAGGDNDGDSPYANVVLDNQGNLYGTAKYGGAPQWGVVYQVTP
jgi:hypothetical protein